MNKDLTNRHEDEVLRGDRFEFGKNWSNFLSTITQEDIENAKKSLTQSLGLKDLKGLTFLDAGSGSGLFSLAAFQLGANNSTDIESVLLGIGANNHVKPNNKVKPDFKQKSEIKFHDRIELITSKFENLKHQRPYIN